ncbi:MAG: MarR family transcriptional regulator [Candidatus Zixiibacteriota bacterium]|nr:MAG: MarR family transcriptional regulator [candidate division Zixibacteria bacterium]
MRTRTGVVRSFRATLRRLERAINKHTGRCCTGVSQAQCHVLLEIDASSALTTVELARTLNLDASTISRTVDSLVRAGLVARSENPEDRRSIHLRVTKRGHEMARGINSDADRFFAEVIGRIPQQRRSTVLKGFEIIVEALVESEQECAQTSAHCNCGGV